MNSIPLTAFISCTALIFFSLGFFFQSSVQSKPKLWGWLAWTALITSLLILCIHFSIVRAIPIWLMTVSLMGTLNVYLGNQVLKLHLKLTVIAGVISIAGLVTTAGVHWL